MIENNKSALIFDIEKEIVFLNNKFKSLINQKNSFTELKEIRGKMKDLQNQLDELR